LITKNKKLILIVEDDESISGAISELLKDNDYEVLHAPNGRDALELLKSQVKPNLILLDLMMPIMDGFVFRENQLAEQSLRDIPVVVMSADGHVEEKKIRTSAAEYLKKPVDIFHLLSTVKKHSSPFSAGQN
jgi:CheY-like chemotaxis protein